VLVQYHDNEYGVLSDDHRCEAEGRRMTVVVKIGGARAVNPEDALSDIAAIAQSSTNVVVIHGGSTAVDDTLERVGINPEYIETPAGVVGRFTDAETMDVFKMAMAGLVNTDLVTGLREAGANAVGLSGVDGGLLTGKRKSAVRVLEDGKKKIRRGDHSGRIQAVNVDLLVSLLDDGYTPVASPPMLADDGVAVNTDADRASAAVAGALGATLISLTDVEGVYSDPDDASTLIERVETSDEYAKLDAAAEGFMTRKVMAATEALEDGAAEVIVADANADTPVSAALTGGGTHILPEAIPDE
jgi:acetylglutamate/LysW-gamma-L-alpha-aminoadipate kinase